MDFYELKAFSVLAGELHYAKAAKKINLSPSALSRMISRLEDETGVILFDRDNREVQLTPEGKEFFQFAQKCLYDQEKLLSDFSHSSDEVSGILHVYASVTACYTIMPPFVKKLAAKYPGIQLSVVTGDPAGAVSAIREGKAELAIDSIPDGGYATLESISVMKSPLVFAASVNSRFVEVNGSPQDIVSSVPLILPKQGLARKRFDSWVKSRNVKPNIIAEAEGNEAVMSITALGLGIGLVPQIVLENGPFQHGFICHSAGNALGYFDIGFIQKKEITGPESVRKIRNAVADILKNLYTDSMK